MRRSSVHEENVRHYVASAVRCHQADMLGARDRFLRLAQQVLDTHKVPDDGMWRARVATVAHAPATP